MKILKKEALTAISLVLIMTFAATMASIQLGQAATDVRIKNWAYVNPQPNKVGVGQASVVVYGIDHLHPIATVNGPFFEGFTLKITDPDGNTETNSVTVDSTRFGYFNFVPDKVGTYYFQLSFAE